MTVKELIETLEFSEDDDIVLVNTGEISLTVESVYGYGNRVILTLGGIPAAE